MLLLLLLQELDLAAAGRDLPSAVSWLKVADDVGTLLDRDASCKWVGQGGKGSVWCGPWLGVRWLRTGTPHVRGA